MIQIYGETGGRPRSVDDLYLIQQEAFKAIVAPFKRLEDAKGGFIVYGCQPDAITNAIAPGMIFLGGEFLEFAGTSNATFPATFGVLETLTNSAQYQDGNTKATRKSRVASLDTSADFTHSLTITKSSYLEIGDLIVDSYTNQGIQGTKTFSNLMAKNINVYDRLNQLTADLATANQAITNLSNTKVSKRADLVPWTDLTLESGFSTGLAGFNTAQYRRTEDGFVHFRGLVSFVNNGGGVVTNLPLPGFNVSNETRIIVRSLGGQFDTQVCLSGASLIFYPQNVPNGANKTLSLDSLCYFADTYA